MEGVFPLVPLLDTVGPMARSVADVALLWSVLSGRPVPEPRLDRADRRPDAAAAGDRRRTADRDERRRGGVGGGARAAGRTRRRGARPRRVARTPGRSSSTRPRGRTRATFPSRADEYSDVMRIKLEAAQRVSRRRRRGGLPRDRGVAAYEPDVDLYVSPVLSASSCRPRTSTSSRSGCRSRRSCAGSTCSAGPGSRSATCSSSRPTTRPCSPRGSPGRAR